MTTNYTELLDYLKNYTNTFVVEDEVYCQVLQLHFDKLIAFTEAVLGIEPFADISKEAGNFDKDFQEGHNALLTDIREKGELLK